MGSYAIANRLFSEKLVSWSSGVVPLNGLARPNGVTK